MMDGAFFDAADVHDLKDGKLYPVEVDGELICLARVDGQVCAFTDNCTHISGPLNQGGFDGHVVTCPWHGAQFDVRSGKVLRGPARQDLYTYQVRVEGEKIKVYLPPTEE
jgi:3-phenylpropionate/trans-cinnamate dioxygenase ferredoxin component